MTNQIGTDKRIEQLIRKHANMIFRIAYQNVKSRSDAEDIFQEVCLSLLTKDAPIFDDDHIKNWLIRVTINKCLNFHKSFWQRNRDELSENTKTYTQPESGLLDEIRRLPKNYRNIIYLYYYEEYTISEIAELLEMKPNTVSSSLQRARKRLKKNLIQGGFDYE